MGKIRVYDLAKEAGIASKELADKLIALGYNIKSHSSTVDDEVADEIRRKVLGTAETEVIEKRISTKGRATIIRRRAQTVRRVSEPAPAVEIKEEPEIIEKSAEEPVTEKITAKPAKKRIIRKKKEEPAEEKPPEEPVETAPAEVESVEPEVAVTPVSVEPEVIPEEQAEVTAEKTGEEEPKPRVVKRVVPPRKGLAKVIKKAAIQVPSEEPKVSARPARPAKGKGKVSSIAEPLEARGDQVEPNEEARAGKGKKKGKRLVQFRSELEERGERYKKVFGRKQKERK